jgi:uncharacterized protein YbjT (DUF2867 family)
MRILVTGASGFVGSTLCDQLTRQGHQIFALMRQKSSPVNLQFSKFEAVAGDLRDPKSLQAAVAQAEVIIHVAGVVSAKTRD